MRRAAKEADKAAATKKGRSQPEEADKHVRACSNVVQVIRVEYLLNLFSFSASPRSTVVNWCTDAAARYLRWDSKCAAQTRMQIGILQKNLVNELFTHSLAYEF